MGGGWFGPLSKELYEVEWVLVTLGNVPLCVDRCAVREI